MKSFRQFLAENASIKWYTTAGKGYALNKKLIAGERLTPEETTVVSDLYWFIRRNRIKSRITLYRGVGSKPPVNLSSPGFLSTSDDYGSAMAYAENHAGINNGPSHLMVIQAKPGDPIASVDAFSEYQGEGEYLILRDAELRQTTKSFDQEDNVWLYTYVVTSPQIND